MQYSLRNDYNETAHPRVLEILNRTNFEQTGVYGKDIYTEQARDLICEKLNDQDADVYFVSGGTQANLVVISWILRPHESIIAPSTGHIAVYEGGAIESTGHKINTLDSLDGKLNSDHIKYVLSFHRDEHMVKPRSIFISNATEIGTIYSKRELESLSEIAKKNNLLLYLDGARLGSALMSDQNDLKFSDLKDLLDIFYIGGTKNGALFGEAIVILNDKLKKNFRYHLKQKGALFAKGRVISLQFLELFKDDLFFDLAKHANKMALVLENGIKKAGYDFLSKSQSNQIFPIFPDYITKALAEKYEFYMWSKFDKKHTCIRLVTSWASDEKFICKFIDDLNQLSKS
jgi:threonine aldolase